MRIVLFSSYYWPEYAGTAPYVTEPAEYLAGLGHDVHVVAGFAHYPEWRPMMPRKLRTREEVNGVTVHRGWHYIPANPSTKARAVYEASMFAGGVLAAASAPKPDVVVGVSPALASGNLARLYARRHGCNYGLIIHDLFGRGASQAGLAGGRVARVLSSIERRMASDAGKLLVLTNAFRDFFVESGFEAEDVLVAPPWMRRELGPLSHSQARESLGWREEDFICLHAGNMGQKQGLSTLIEVARELRDRHVERVRFVFLGDGNDRRALEDLSASYGLSNIDFKGGVTDEEYDRALVGANLLLLSQRPSVSDMSYPSKLSAYLAAGRPIIGAVASDSEAARLIGESGAGRIEDPRRPRRIAETVAELMDSSSDRLDAMGMRGRDFAVKRLSADAIMRQYAWMVEALSQPRPSKPSRRDGSRRRSREPALPPNLIDR